MVSMTGIVTGINTSAGVPLPASPPATVKCQELCAKKERSQGSESFLCRKKNANLKISSRESQRYARMTISTRFDGIFRLDYSTSRPRGRFPRSLSVALLIGGVFAGNSNFNATFWSR